MKKRYNLRIKNMTKVGLINKIRGIFFNDFKIKLICVALAIAMYAFVGNVQMKEKVFASEITTVGLKEGLIISNTIPKNVSIAIKAKQDILDKITDNQFNVRLNLSDITSTGEYKIRLKNDIPPAMNNFFSTISIKNSTIPIVIDRLIEKSLSVKPRITGKLPGGFDLVNVTARPDTVTVEGPESILSTINSIDTRVIDISNISSSLTKPAELIRPSQSIKFITYGLVDLYIELKQQTSTYSLQSRRVLIKELRSGLSAFINEDSISIEISGNKSDIEEYLSKNWVVSINCYDINKTGEYQKNLIPMLPGQFKLISIEPKMVNLTVNFDN